MTEQWELVVSDVFFFVFVISGTLRIEILKCFFNLFGFLFLVFNITGFSSLVAFRIGSTHFHTFTPSMDHLDTLQYNIMVKCQPGVAAQH